MTRRLLLGNGAALVLGSCLAATGCGRAPLGAPPASVTVAVSHPVEREVTDSADYTARIAAVDSVEVRAHVWGYLEKVHFQEGALVRKGDVLFELDPRPYRAALDQAKAKVRQDEARAKFDKVQYERNLRLVSREAVSRSELDQSASNYAVDLANIEADKALVESYELNLGYTKVTAPVSGRVSRYNVTVGNLVQSGDQGGGTLLTTIVSVDPMYAYFDVDEITVLRVRQSTLESNAGSARPSDWPVSLGLATEEGFPHRGTINFVDNQVNPQTGTLRTRGVFANKDELLSPGFFARVRLPLGPPRRALLVSDRALDNDQGQKVLYVLNAKDEVVSRPVRVGALHDGLRVIEDGLKLRDRVIVNGLSHVRPGMTVVPKLVAMQTPEGGGKDRMPREPVRVGASRPPTRGG